ncbi:MAG: porin [Bacteroidaceae bacterium]|nr:porin [Bacteroidaceae bacterium]
MKRRNVIFAIIMACFCASSFAQESTSPKGKAIIQVFGNFHTGFGKQNDDRGFELDRSYLGYQYDLGKGLQVKGVMDIGQSDDVNDYHRIAYIKNAQISWKTGKLTLTGGLISTIQFNMQEKFWGYRYIMKSFQDQYKFGSSADLGVSASYKLADWLTADAIVVNGEGYKKIQKNDGLMYGLGATLTPVKGLSMRIYYGLNEGADDTKEDKQNLATFIGYKGEGFSLGAEYNLYKNDGNVKGNDLYGFSIYGSTKLNKMAEIYARYDNLSSKDDWNEAKDESAILAGLQFKLGKYVKIAPNFRMNIPKANGADNRYMGYVSCYFGL